MKKLSLLILTLLIATTAFSQWSAGPRIGANFSTLTGRWSENDDSKSKWIGGFTGGAVGGYTFNDLVTLRAEFLYTTMGNKTEYEGGIKNQASENYYLRERYNCIQIVVVSQFNFVMGSFILFAYPGLYATLKLNGKYKTQDESGSIKWEKNDKKSTTDDITIDPDFNRRRDFGAYIGGGVGKELGPGRLELDLRFGIGLIDLNKFEDKDAKQAAIDNGYRPYRNLNFGITAAYMIPIGGAK